MWLSIQTRNNRFALLTRVIGAFLLAAIAWGSTFEFTHHHDVRSALRAQQVATETQTNGNDEAASRQLPPLSSRTRTSECSICQLQHNLATTLISEPAGLTSDAIQSAPQSAFVQIELADFTRSQRGRAPPSLL
jgi:hypothetical protein